MGTPTWIKTIFPWYSGVGSPINAHKLKVCGAFPDVVKTIDAYENVHMAKTFTELCYTALA